MAAFATKKENGLYYYQQTRDHRMRVASSFFDISNFYEKLESFEYSDISGHSERYYDGKNWAGNDSAAVERVTSLDRETTKYYQIIIPASHPFFESITKNEDEEVIAAILDAFPPDTHRLSSPTWATGGNEEFKVYDFLVQGPQVADFEIKGVKIVFTGNYYTGE